MANADAVFIGRSVKPEELLLRFGNRHGLITGATGTGKTVTLQIMAEGFSKAGVPVFAADVKGDLSGIAAAGGPNDAIIARAKQVGMDDFGFEAFPTIFWDLYGEQGHPVRTTITEMGPLLLSRLMSLTEAQEGALNIAFRIADQEGMALLDMKDLRAMLSDLAGRASELRTDFGNIAPATIGAIQRRLLVLDEQGADNFFGEPALSISDLMRTTPDGRGYISILAADKLMQAPALYSTFLLSLMSELFEQLPEVGDPDKPRLVFFFDEAHLLFDEAPPALLQKVEQVVRLIRSKGVGIYFITQNPLDIPDTVLAQLGNRVQHALRAYTPREQKAVKAAASTFRQNPQIDTETAIMQLGTGEALTSMLEDKGVPSMVQKTLIRPPSSRLGPITPDERRALITKSPVYGIYEQAVDRESAYEILTKRAQEKADAAAAAAAEVAAAKQQRQVSSSGASRTLETITDRIVRNVASQVGTQIGRALMRGILGSLTGGRR
ncbi:helicase HerA-like C-terminal domain-containing protein [Rhodoligotrophos defluvii]|uniref:helicase HerA-like C-terminal domain-containing protein n=1 Tax=Rhodoligotrophos defluvii TaxID=2561934 RepID=UPI0010C9F5F4|nr:helicase HerA-like C-terminal domain-containing protein [Rhodoligotrophos defluvii]